MPNPQDSIDRHAFQMQVCGARGDQLMLGAAFDLKVGHSLLCARHHRCAQLGRGFAFIGNKAFVWAILVVRLFGKTHPIRVLLGDISDNDVAVLIGFSDAKKLGFGQLILEGLDDVANQVEFPASQTQDIILPPRFDSNSMHRTEIEPVLSRVDVAVGTDLAPVSRRRPALLPSNVVRLADHRRRPAPGEVQ